MERRRNVLLRNYDSDSDSDDSSNEGSSDDDDIYIPTINY